MDVRFVDFKLNFGHEIPPWSGWDGLRLMFRERSDGSADTSLFVIKRVTLHTYLFFVLTSHRRNEHPLNIKYEHIAADYRRSPATAEVGTVIILSKGPIPYCSYRDLLSTGVPSLQGSQTDVTRLRNAKIASTLPDRAPQ